MDNVAVELDITIEPNESPAELARSMAEASGRDISFHVVAEHGPTGWPLVRFSGDRADIEGMLIEHGFEDGIETYIV